MRNPAVYTFWLGAAGETAKPPARDLRDLTTSVASPLRLRGLARDLRDLTSAEVAIYQQAYAEGHAAARQKARQSVARDWGTSGSADVMQAAQRFSGAAALDWGEL